MLSKRDQFKEMLYKIHSALEDYLYPPCDKCHSRRTERSCECEKSKQAQSS